MPIVNRTFGPADIAVKVPSPEMERITGLIRETETRIVEVESELSDKLRTLAVSEAGRVMDEDDRSASIKAGLARKAVDVLQDEIRESQRVLEGLKMKLADAEQAERERLHSELIDKIQTDGGKLLSLLDEIDKTAMRFNQLVEEATDLMEVTFWKTDSEKALGAAGLKLPEHVRKIPFPDKSKPWFTKNFFVERLKEFIDD